MGWAYQKALVARDLLAFDPPRRQASEQVDAQPEAQDGQEHRPWGDQGRVCGRAHVHRVQAVRVARKRDLPH